MIFSYSVLEILWSSMALSIICLSFFTSLLNFIELVFMLIYKHFIKAFNLYNIKPDSFLTFIGSSGIELQELTWKTCQQHPRNRNFFSFQVLVLALRYPKKSLNMKTNLRIILLLSLTAILANAQIPPQWQNTLGDRKSVV